MHVSQVTIWTASVVCGKTLAVFIAMFIGLKLFGKRQLGQLNLYDLAMIMALSNSIQNAMTGGKTDLYVGVAAASTLLIVGRVISEIFIRLPKFEERVVGMPTILISNGHLHKDQMRKEGLCEEEIFAALRAHGLKDYDEVKLAALEVDGTLSVVPNDTKSSHTKKVQRKVRYQRDK